MKISLGAIQERITVDQKPNYEPHIIRAKVDRKYGCVRNTVEKVYRKTISKSMIQFIFTFYFRKNYLHRNFIYIIYFIY
jgi:hypothetical protein